MPESAGILSQACQSVHSFTCDSRRQIGLIFGYNKQYIGFRVDGKACNFATCRPRKTAMWLAIALPKSEEIDAMLAASDIDLLEYDPRGRRYRFRLGEGDPAKHAVILKDLLKRGYDRRNAE